MNSEDNSSLPVELKASSRLEFLREKIDELGEKENKLLALKGVYINVRKSGVKIIQIDI